MSHPLPLEGIYLYLVRNGMPLSVRDYQDAVRALANGHGGHDRDALRTLCETLWCRHEHETVLLENLFRELPKPPEELAQQLFDRQTSADEIKNDGIRSCGPAEPPPPVTVMGTTRKDQHTSVEFAGQTETGSGLPRVRFPARAERFILSPRPAIGVRSMIIAWRRFRRTQRAGPKVEVDIDATIAEQGRRGRLLEPILVPARCNQARIVVGVDVSPSMAPWRRWNALLEESLRASRFAGAPLFYFDNVPSEEIYERPSLTNPVKLADAWRQNPAAAALIIGDAGAARGRINRARIEATRVFLKDAQQHWSPIAWLNPMPKARWTRTSSDPISRLPGVRMFELTEDGLIGAIDFLRGKGTA